MVALKLRFWPFWGADCSEKQERRGGIETRALKSCWSVKWSKQERRGGIETPARVACPVQPMSGSRNAVVALKPRAGAPIPPRLSLKQERRGGIETRTAPLRSPPRPPEAGTPWWH